jgi:hypothetical protein
MSQLRWFKKLDGTKILQQKNGALGWVWEDVPMVEEVKPRDIIGEIALKLHSANRLGYAPEGIVLGVEEVQLLKLHSEDYYKKKPDQIINFHGVPVRESSTKSEIKLLVALKCI